MTTRQTLTRVPKSILSMMFNGRWEHKLPLDKNQNIFLDFNPILFRHLLDQLQTFDATNFCPPSDSSLVEPFKKMLRKLGLNELLSSEKNLITFNVGGNIITNRQTTFTQILNSSLNPNVSSSNAMKVDKNHQVFVDHNPKLFRYLVNQLREKSSKNICHIEAPSKEEKISFQRMLDDLDICGE
jgi:hypothetical protein